MSWPLLRYYSLVFRGLVKMEVRSYKRSCLRVTIIWLSFKNSSVTWLLNKSCGLCFKGQCWVVVQKDRSQRAGYFLGIFYYLRTIPRAGAPGAPADASGAENRWKRTNRVLNRNRGNYFVIGHFFVWYCFYGFEGSFILIVLIQEVLVHTLVTQL